MLMGYAAPSILLGRRNATDIGSTTSDKDAAYVI